MNTNNLTTYIARGTCCVVGAALAGVGMVATYKAAAAVGNEYLMVAGPLVALAAPLTAIFIEIAHESRQRLKMLALLIAFGLCGAVVFFTASERNHDGRAVGEAQRLASRTAAERATDELTEAKAARIEATAKADKVRGIPEAKCRNTCLSLKASEQAAVKRVADAEQAVRDASSHAVTDSGIQQADWLMPLAVDFGSVVLLWLGFSLGTIERKPAKVETVYVAEPVYIEAPAPQKPARKKVDPVKSERSKRGAATKAARRVEAAKQAAIAAGSVVALKA